MAQVVVDSSVMRDKAKSLETASTRIQTLFDEMLEDVKTTASAMKGETIETQKQRFESMRPTFETISKDMKAYSTFLTQAAEQYEQAENQSKQKAEEQGKVF